MPVTLDQAAANIGADVAYVYGERGELRERGVITSVSKYYVFVRYGDSFHSKATHPDLLEFVGAQQVSK